MCEKVVESHQPGVHVGGFLRADADPKKMYSLCKRSGISQSSVEGGFRIRFLIAHDERTRGAAETSDIGEHAQVVERHLKRLHTAHRKAGHGAVFAIGNCLEFRVHVWNENLRQVLSKNRRHVLHGLHAFWRA